MRRLYMPNIRLTPPKAQVSPGPDYGALALALAHRIRTHKDQDRPVLTWDEDIARVARLRCADMFRRAYLAHTNPDGVGPNRFLEQNGVRLPDGYDGGRTANNCESIGLNKAEAGAMLALFLDSPGHAAHILGRGWWQGQSRIGVGVGPSWDNRQTIWVVLTLHK